jgi:integrase/recombinase XerD
MIAPVPVAGLLEAFFTDRLMRERQASPHTIAAYRDTFRLLLAFVQQRLGKAPSALTLADLDAPLIGTFLDHLERGRANTARTRNARLAAIHSFFRYAALQEPAHAGLIQRVLAMPNKRYDRRLIAFLTREEMAALLAAPDRSTWVGRRDQALLLLALQTGLRVSELIGLRCEDVVLVRALTYAVAARGARNAVRRYAARRSRRCACGCANAPAAPRSRSSPAGAGAP